MSLYNISNQIILMVLCRKNMIGLAKDKQILLSLNRFFHAPFHCLPTIRFPPSIFHVINHTQTELIPSFKLFERCLYGTSVKLTAD